MMRHTDKLTQVSQAQTRTDSEGSFEQMDAQTAAAKKEVTTDETVSEFRGFTEIQCPNINQMTFKICVKICSFFFSLRTL